VKKSKVVRKELNGMRAMSEVPWPARRFKYPPTFSSLPIGASCQRNVQIDVQRRGRVLGFVRRPQARIVVCGGQPELIRGRVVCPRCRAREAATGRMLVRQGYRKPSRRALRRAHDGRAVKLIPDAISRTPWTVEGAARLRAHRTRQAAGRFFSRRKV
jgi:hypothetical protein